MRAIANVQLNTDNFAAWLGKTNDLLYALSTEILTANSTQGNTTGNAFLVGYLGSNTFYTTTLVGGAPGANNLLTIASNTVFSGSTANGANFNASANVSGVNLNASTLLKVGANVQANITHFQISQNISSVDYTMVLGAKDFSITNGSFITLNSNTVGANTLTTKDLNANNILFISGSQTTNTVSVSSTSNTIIDQFPKTSGTTAKYIVSMTNATRSLVYSLEILVAFSNTDTFVTRYGEIFNTAVLGTFTFELSGANAVLAVTATNNTPYTIKVLRTLI
jgi:hypothetical protein